MLSDVMPGAGLEPAPLAGRDFKSFAGPSDAASPPVATPQHVQRYAAMCRDAATNSATSDFRLSSPRVDRGER